MLEFVRGLIYTVEKIKASRLTKHMAPTINDKTLFVLYNLTPAEVIQ